MNKLNKKGFTLIEMLVVIAIIAVLVAIIIPTISSATTKASAAANAANLRSFKAELTTAYLSGSINKGNTGAAVTPPSGVTVPTSKKMPGLENETDATAAWDGENIVVKFGSFTINDFATTAEKGTALAHAE